MKKYVSLFTAVSFIFLQPLLACSSFFINKNGELVFGRNYDWVTGAGMVSSNLKGLFKTSLKMEDGNSTDWVSKYGSITFNQYGKEFPTGGMNEKGLVVELMWLEGTEYSKPDNRPALGILQWIQYQLDNCANIEEVISTDVNIRISAHTAPLHYLIADANGNAATIEFLGGKQVVHKGKDLPFAVLTNNSYATSAKTAYDANVLSGNKKFSIQDNSLLRFTKACSMVQQYKQNEISKPAVDYGFDILNAVSQGDFTKWSIVYDLKNKKIYFKTADFRDIKWLSFSSFDFTCTALPRSLDMNQPITADVSKNFKAFDAGLNRKLIEQSARESKDRVQISDKQKESLASYPQTVKCKN
jgi:penicillin V acylase-like amidase (Ntn superfamily)